LLRSQIHATAGPCLWSCGALAAITVVACVPIDEPRVGVNGVSDTDTDGASTIVLDAPRVVVMASGCVAANGGGGASDLFSGNSGACHRIPAEGGDATGGDGGAGDGLAGGAGSAMSGGGGSVGQIFGLSADAQLLTEEISPAPTPL